MKTMNFTSLSGMLILILGLSFNGIGQTITKLDPSSNPPNGLLASKVPQFVVIGWDDNDREASIIWSLDFFKNLKNPAGTGNAATYDGTPVRTSYYNTSVYITTGGADGPDQVKWAWNRIQTDGHEVGNHTHSHATWLKTLDATGWEKQIDSCNNYMSMALPPKPGWWMSTPNTGAGITKANILGFRTPFLAYGGALFPTLKKLGFTYDCSIEEGNQSTQNGTNFYWPYTLDNSSLSGHYASWLGNTSNPDGFTIPDVPGLWELPNHIVIVPDDATSTQKGYPTGMRTKILAVPGMSWFVDKLTGFDYNMWAQCGLTRAEVTAILKHNLDLRYSGNRAPFMFGAHTGEYHSGYNASCIGAPSELDRRGAIEDYINYALTKSDVRIVSGIDIIKWMQNPVALGAAVGPFTLTTNATNGTIAKSPSAATYTSGTVVTLTATPSSGYKFDSWSGDVTGTTNPTTVTMSANKTVTANFSLIGVTTYSLTITATNGTVTKSPDKTAYTAGESVLLTATANTGYTFNSWSGDASGTSNTVTITMNGNKTVTALFDKNQSGGGCTDFLDLMINGTFVGYKDAIGSDLVINTTALPATVSATWTQAKMPDASTCPWIDFEATLPTGLKMTGACSIKITYKSDQELILSLPQPPLSNDGISYQIPLPTAGTLTTITADISTFAQPSWIDLLTQTAPLNLDTVGALSIAPNVATDIAAVSGSFEITELKVFGIILTDINTTVKESIQIVSVNQNSIAITGAEQGTYQIQLFSIDGKLIQNSSNILNENRNTITLNNALTSGVYLVKINGNNSTILKKISIQ